MTNPKKKTATRTRTKGNAISFRPLPEVADLLERARKEFGERYISVLIEESCVTHLKNLLHNNELAAEKVQKLLKKGRSRFA